jgi:MYXO-CTERM domain-containing protein
LPLKNGSPRARSGATACGSQPDPAAAAPGWLLPLLLLAALGVVGYSLATNMGQGPKDEAVVVGERLGPLKQLIKKVMALPRVEAILGEKIAGIVKILAKLGQ